MKKSFLLLTIVMTLTFKGISQDFTKTLQSKTWYLTGHLYDKKPLTITTDNKSNYDSETKFLKSGKLFSYEITKESMFDANGNELAAGQHLKDSTYSYFIKKDIIKIDYSIKSSVGHEKGMTRISYYKIKELADKKGYELNPVTESEFK